MSTVKERFDDILHKPMNRQQFLKNVGLMILAAVGVTNIINTFDGKHGSKVSSTGGGSQAYGASVYAGGKKPM
jgi:hypothetical protein